MKISVLVFLILLGISCSPEYIEISNGDKPFKGEKNETIYFQRGEVTIKEIKTSFLESNFYVSIDGGSAIFLFNYCRTDCNEKITQFLFQDNSFAFLLGGSNRYKNGNRLKVFQMENRVPNVLFDSQDEVYKTFRFEDKKFIYTLQDGTERVIELK
jgi:hypothetical protein